MNNLQPDTLIRNPHAQPVLASVELDQPASRVWELVGNFAGFAEFVPGLSHIDTTGEGPGSLRHKFFKDGHHVVEQLNSRDEQARCMTWTTLYNTLGVGQLWAAMQVQELPGNRSRATWTIMAEPLSAGEEELPAFAQFIQGFADAAMNNVRTLLS